MIVMERSSEPFPGSKIVLCRDRKKNDGKNDARGLGREEAILPFPPPPTAPDHTRLVFAGFVFATFVLSESLTEARTS